MSQELALKYVFRENYPSNYYGTGMKFKMLHIFINCHVVNITLRVSIKMNRKGLLTQVGSQYFFLNLMLYRSQNPHKFDNKLTQGCCAVFKSIKSFVLYICDIVLNI